MTALDGIAGTRCRVYGCRRVRRQFSPYCRQDAWSGALEVQKRRFTFCREERRQRFPGGVVVRGHR